MIINDYLNITCEDNMSLMNRYDDGHFDLAIIDPPYGINGSRMNMGKKSSERRAYTTGTKGKDWDNNIPDRSFFDELFRVSKNQIIWGGNYMTEFLKPTSAWIFWDKQVAAGVSFSDGELAWSSFNSVLRKYVIPYSGFIGRDKNRIHVTQKPVLLYETLLLAYAKKGFKILDTHMGSGSIAIALDSINKKDNMDLTLTASEIDEVYFNDAINRIREETDWTILKLFE